MQFTRLCIERPIVLLMALAALMMLGLRARGGLPAELDPKVDVPVVNITTVWPGASPEEVEERLVRPLEDAIATVGNVETINARALENLAIVTVRLRLGSNLNAAAADIRARVDSVRRDLPDEIEPPQVAKFDYNARPLMVLGITGSGDSRGLRQLVDDEIKPRLGRVPGLGAVTIVGGLRREIQVQVEPERLSAYGVSLTDLLRPLGAASRSVPAGSLVLGRRDVSVRVLGEFNSLEDLRNTPIPAPAAAGRMLQQSRYGAVSEEPTALLRLRDLAEITDTFAEREQMTRVGGKDSVGIILTRVPDANSMDVAEGLHRELKGLEESIPPDVKITVLQDHSRAIGDALEDIYSTLIIGSLLAVLIVYVFLHSLKDTLIVACAIPSSIIVTFIVMYFAGFSLNQMTMLALSLSVGILVDDSILVLECIHRHRAMGKSPQQAALDGRAEIGLADAANTFVDVVVFVPIAFMGGIVGQFFREFGLTISTATLASLYVSFSLTPMLAARWLKPGEGLTPPAHGFGAWFDRTYERLERQYERVLALALERRSWVVTLGFGSLALTGFLAWQMLGFDFTPSIDRGQVTVEVELPPGAALSATDGVLRRIEAVAAEIPEVDREKMLSSAGEILAGFGSLPDRGPQLGQLTLNLIEKQGFLDRLLHPGGQTGMRRRSDEQVAADLRKRLEPKALGASITVAVARGLTAARAPVEIDLHGKDLAELEQVTAEARTRLSKLSLLRNVDSSYRRGDPELQVVLDRERAEDLVVSPAEVAGAIRTAIAGNSDFRLREGERSYPIRLRVARASGSIAGLDADGLKDLVLVHRGPTSVTVDDVATVRLGSGPSKILRSNRMRRVILYAQVTEGTSLGAAQAAAESALADMDWGNVRWAWGGDVNDMEQSAGLMTAALLLAIALSYMLMSALFNSPLYPITIMASVPMALVGGLVAMILTGATMNIVSMIGIVMLVGLVSKNAILLVDYTNTLRASGLSRNEALRRAGPVRLRPILMTTISTVSAMTPVALQIGRASEMRSPMAIVVIGGLILSTLLTLLVIPAMYTFFDDFGEGLIRLGRRLFGGRRDEAAVPTTLTPEPD